MMKGEIEIAFCWSMDDMDLGAALERLKGYGFEGIELWPSAIERHGADNWAKALRETGMRCVQLCPYFDIVNGPDAIADSFVVLDEYLAFAKTLDCHRLRVFTGPVHNIRSVGPKDATPAQWEAAIDALQRLCDLAAEDGVELCLECHEGMLTESSESAQRLVTGVSRPNLVVNLQIPLDGDPWEKSVALLGQYTSHIHIHNWHSDSMDFGGGLTFLSNGWFQWEPVLTALLPVASRGITLSVEHPNHGGKHDPWETAAKDGRYLVALREKLGATGA